MTLGVTSELFTFSLHLTCGWQYKEVLLEIPKEQFVLCQGKTRTDFEIPAALIQIGNWKPVTDMLSYDLEANRRKWVDAAWKDPICQLQNSLIYISFLFVFICRCPNNRVTAHSYQSFLSIDEKKKKKF